MVINLWGPLDDQLYREKITKIEFNNIKLRLEAAEMFIMIKNKKKMIKVFTLVP